MGYDLFISYKRSDNENGSITRLVEHIKADFAGFAGRALVPFFDVEEIHGMEDWRHRILQGLRESHLLLACISPDYLKSEYCEWEFIEYLKNEIGHSCFGEGVAPIYFVEVPGWEGKEFEQQCAAWVADLRRRHNFDLRPWFHSGVESLRDTTVKERMDELNTQIKDRITRGELAEKSLGNVERHNPHFIGRTTELRRLRETAALGKVGVLTAVHGVGGLGKSALATEYAHAFVHEYGGGRWQVRCEGMEDLRFALATLAAPLNLEFTDEEKMDLERQFQRVLAELHRLADANAPHRCLLLLDNVDKPALLAPVQTKLLPSADWLHIIATTRLGEDELYGTQHDRTFLPVDELLEADAIELIESYQPNRSFASEAERDAARDIVLLLDRFTLAVESAAVYLGQFAGDVSCVAFLARLRKEGLIDLDNAAKQAGVEVRHDKISLADTLAPTLERLSPAELLTLRYAALLAPDNIALPWLRTLVSAQYPEYGTDAEPGYPDPWVNLLRRLLSLRLLQSVNLADDAKTPRICRMHRVVQQLLQAQLKENDELEQRQDEVTTLVKERDAVLRQTTQWQPARWEVAPLAALAGLWADTGHPDAAWLLSQVGTRYYALAEWTQAEPLMRRVASIYEKNLGEDHPYVATALNNLAQLLQDTNRLAEAEPLMRRALLIDESSYGPDHPDVARYLNNLASLLQDTNRLSEAEPLMRRALSIDKSSYGPDHPDVARDLNNLAQLLQATNSLSEAEPLELRAAEILLQFTQQTKHMHPNLEACINIYTTMLQELGHTPAAIHEKLEELGQRYGVDIAGMMGKPANEPSSKLHALLEELMDDQENVEKYLDKLQQEDPELFMEFVEWYQSQK